MGVGATVGCGGGCSTTKLVTAGVGSGLPVASTARTRSECSPGASAGSVNGEVHGVYAPPSIEHSNVEPGSFDENVKAVPSEATVVSGATVS